MRDTCLGLKGLHAQGIVHLDIKPDNILLASNDSFKICDFGMAREVSSFSFEDKNNEEIPEGDDRYLAQELLCYNQNKHGVIDLLKADIFALGCTAYELVQGVDMPKNGQFYADLRQGRVVFNKYT
jgi:serine/threonine protein kinase